MSVPGIDLLNVALSAIVAQSITYIKAASRTLNDVGQWLTTYDSPITILGSFQPVARSMYTQLGLNFNKDYFYLYTSNDVIDLDRDITADQVQFNGITYQCEAATEWYAIDGWKSVLCVALVD
jgi:E217 collar protein gp28